MNIVTYSNHRLQELALEAGTKPFSIMRDAEARAIQFLFWVLNFVWEICRFLAGVLFIPKVLFGAAMVFVGLRPEPTPKLDILAAQKAQADGEKKRGQSRKIGMNEMKSGSLQ